MNKGLGSDLIHSQLTKAITFTPALLLLPSAHTSGTRHFFLITQLTATRCEHPFLLYNITATVNAGTSTYFILVLRAVGGVRLERSELTALGAGLCARIQLTQLQEVTIFCHLLFGQMGNHQSFLQVATTLRDRTADKSFPHSHLGKEHRQMTWHRGKSCF